MLLKNIEYLVTQNQERIILENHDLRIEKDRITAIGQNLTQKNNEQVIDCSNKILMPGLVNTHTHVPMTLLRGFSDNKKLQNWLQEDIFPAEAKLTERDVFLGSMLGCIEMISTGTTTFNDMYEEMGQVAQAAKLTGIRSLLSHGVIDKDVESSRKTIDKAVDFVVENQHENLVQPGFSPHAVYTVTDQALLELKDYSKVFNTIYHIHLSETEKENNDCIKRTGKTPTQHLNSLGVINKNFIGAHGVWLQEKDIKILSENKASIAHNPSANLKLGSGIAPIPKLLQNGVNVSLGTDGVASNNNLNLFEEAKTAALLHKRENPTLIDEQQVLDMATINGARALNMEDEIGSITVGKKADILLIDKNKIELNPQHGKRGLISNLVYSFNGNVDDVIVDGEFRVKDGELIDINKDIIINKARKVSEKF